MGMDPAKRLSRTYTRPLRGMAASDPDQSSDPSTSPGSPSTDATPGDSPNRVECLSASALEERLVEEVNRAGRHGTSLSCLLVAIEDLDELMARHGSELAAQAFAYAGPALRRELRCFDRVGRPSENELLVLLPGADGPRGEIVARRMIDRLRAIKIEVGGVRRPLRISVGLATWHEDLTGEQLVDHAREAAHSERNGTANGVAVA
jgi:diguanylate cyclase (GGDEF)-like protein